MNKIEGVGGAGALKLLSKSPGSLVVAVRTVLAAALAAVTTLEVVLLGEDDKSFFGVIEIFGIQLFVGHCDVVWANF